ncbi:putative multidrug export ATP-binding/permease protein [Geobacillus stearothermophilus]|nr:putative multidrug export ATP-binding/permease protein [Geobacillus stearothermophilus]
MLVKALTVFLLYFILYAALEFLLLRLNFRTINKFKRITQKRLISSILVKDIFHIQKFSVGDIVYRGIYDISKICDLSLYLITEIPVHIIFLLVINYFLFKMNYILAIISLCLFLLESVYSLLFSNQFKVKADDVKDSESNLLDVLKQIIERILFIRLNRLQNVEVNRYIDSLDHLIQKSESFYIFENLHKQVMSIMAGIRQMFVIAVGAFLIYKGEMTVGSLFAFNQMMLRLGAPLEVLRSAFFVYKDIVSSFERIKPFINYNRVNLEKVEQSDTHIHLSCKNVNFKIDHKILIKDLNFIVNKGEKVCIIGESGSGKSIFCKLIAGIYDYEGEITIYPWTKSNRPYIGFLVDECSLIRATIRENLTYGWTGPPFSDNELIDVLRKVRLTNLLSKSHVLDELIDKSMLSRGEQQRLELARLMLMRPQLIILDEPTSALDQETEKIVWKNFRDTCIDSTIIYTTHRIEIVYLNDRIVDIKELKLN